MEYAVDFQTQYNQFYICDKNSPLNTNSGNFWTEDAYNDRIAVEDGVLGIGTECYGHIRAELIIRKTANEIFDIARYDHIVEASLKIKSGTLQLLDCPNRSVELELKLEPGEYRVRTYSSNLTSVEGDDGDDFYAIEIWPQHYDKRKVLKRFK